MADKRCLVVGAGTMGGGHARLISSGRVAGAALAGIVDVDGARAEAAAGAAGGAPHFTSLEEAIGALKPDAAYVATPDALHRAPVEALAAAGVAILVEKPLATTTEDARAMVEAVQRGSVYAEVNYSNRWNPPYVEAKRAIDRGETGEALSFNVRLNNPISSPRDNLSWSATSSPAWFLMSHCLDLACWLGGRRAHSVFATGGKGVLAAAGKDTWDWIHASVRWDGGGDGFFESAWVLPESWPGGIEFTFRMLGTKGLVDIDTTRQSLAVAGQRFGYPSTLNWNADRFTAFVRGIDGQGRTRVTFEEGAHITAILVAVHRSLETGVVEAVTDQLSRGSPATSRPFSIQRRSAGSSFAAAVS